MKTPVETPTTVITGALGSGKTTIIVNLVKQLPQDYKLVWLKNEYGDVNIDSELANESNIKTAEVLNGCLCCVLIGKLSDAIAEILQKYSPERLIIETAGTAHPFPIVNEIHNTEGIFLDGLITVVDALNYQVFEDKSYLARKQAEYVDLFIINKTGLVKEKELEDVLDDVYDLYPNTPKVQTKDGTVQPDLLIGLDSRFISKGGIEDLSEVYTPEEGHKEKQKHYHHADDVDTFSFSSALTFNLDKLEKALASLKPTLFYRIKGIVKSPKGFMLLNVVLGRVTWQKLSKYSGDTRITLMGRNISKLESDVVESITNCENT